MSSEVYSIQLSKHEKMIEYDVQIRSTEHFKQVGVHEKNDRNEINTGGSPRVTMHLRNHLLIGRASLVIILRDVARFTPLLARLVQ